MSATYGTIAGVFENPIPAAVRSPIDVFNDIFTVFLGLGTLVGIVVIGYMVWKGYQYREGSGKGKEADIERPSLGDLPEGEGGGRKLIFSFAISAIIVLGLLGWTYGSLLYVEAGPPVEEDSNPIEIQVTGYQFGWEFEYPNGHTTSTLRIPEDRAINLQVTSDDVFHNFGIPELGLKADAIPGQTTSTWLYADEPGNHTARCYELCGTGHSLMTAEVVVMEQSAYESWYESTANETERKP